MADNTFGIFAGGIGILIAAKYGPAMLKKYGQGREDTLAEKQSAATVSEQLPPAEIDSTPAMQEDSASNPPVTDIAAPAAVGATATQAQKYTVTLSNGRVVPADGPNAVVVPI